ncbi:site-specific integrase [Pikeienuella sp. HZG-20]|uniref:tyrosine-type recombinase/integrase n=1 Tax=Paludibacillus litoralis TaxID=3133267 RepID=UPI0030EF3055
MSVYKPKNSPYWHYDFQIRGRRIHGTTGQASKTAARRVETLERQRAAEPAARQPITLDDAAGAYFSRQIEGRSIAPTTDYQIANLIHGLGGGALLSEIGQEAVARYTMRRRRAVADTSVNREIEVLRAIWYFARDVLDRDTGRAPNWGKLFFREPEPTKRELSDAEETRLMKALRPDLRPLIAFALATGLRLDGCLSLRWSDIDMAALTLSTRGKGGKTLIKPITRRIAALLSAQPRTGATVFTYVCQKSRAGRRKGERYPLTKTGWRRAWAAALAEAEIESLRFHDLRHTFATRLLRASGNLGLVQKALDHSDISTSTRYAHVLDEDLRAGMAAMEGVPKIRRAK